MHTSKVGVGPLLLRLRAISREMSMLATIIARSFDPTDIVAVVIVVVTALTARA